MKKTLFIMLVLSGFLFVKADAQYVREKPGFSLNLSIGHYDRAPYRGAVWVGPQWEWRGGHYVEVPGHWVRPQRRGGMWVDGHWANDRRGYRWVPGHWR